MKKLEMMEKLNKIQAAAQKLPNGIDIADADVVYDGRFRLRIYGCDADALREYADMAGLYCKTVNDEFDSYHGLHVLDENGTEIYTMVRKDGAK